VAGRLLAGAGGGLTLLSAVLVTAAGDRAGRLWSAGYLSEAGVSGQPGAGWYRIGMVGLAAGVLTLAGAIRPIVALAAWLLATCAGFIAISGAVACSPGCPLPPHQRAETADIIHAGASIAAVFAAIAAVLLVWQVSFNRDAFGHGDAGRDSSGDVPPRLLWMSMLTSLTVLPMVVSTALAMLIHGRGLLPAVLERVTLIVLLCWVLTASGCLASRRAR